MRASPGHQGNAGAVRRADTSGHILNRLLSTAARELVHSNTATRGLESHKGGSYDNVDRLS